MPTFNRAYCIESCLNALYHAEYPKNHLRLIFVDAYSTDKTYEYLLNFAIQHKHEYEQIITLQQHGNIPTARNICLNHRGNSEYVVYIDSDIIVNPDFLKRLIGLAKIGGIVGISYAYKDQHPLTTSVTERDEVGTGCTLFRADIIEKTGLFDVNLPFAEDTDYCFRAKKLLGCKILQDERIPLLHLGKGRWGSLRGRLERTFKYRRFYSKYVFKTRRLSMRTIIYSILDFSLMATVLNAWLIIPVVAYFLVEVFKTKNLLTAIGILANALIIPFLITLGAIESLFGRMQVG